MKFYLGCHSSSTKFEQPPCLSRKRRLVKSRNQFSISHNAMFAIKCKSPSTPHKREILSVFAAISGREQDSIRVTLRDCPCRSLLQKRDCSINRLYLFTQRGSSGNVLVPYKQLSCTSLQWCNSTMIAKRTFPQPVLFVPTKRSLLEPAPELQPSCSGGVAFGSAG